MTYPQPSSVAPVLAGQDHFRLLTELTTSGDIYESEVSALAFALGPNSDLANILLTYFAGDTSSVQQALISPDRSFVGRIDARNEANYPGPPGSSRRAGRILISTTDIWDPRWRPTNFDANDRIQFVNPVLDVVQYFTSPDSLIAQRSDKPFSWQYYDIPSPLNTTWMVIPAFGRKSGFFTFANKGGLLTTTVSVYGVKTSISNSPGVIGSFEKQLMTPVALLAGDATEFQFTSSTMGVWDMFAISITDYNGGPLPITVSLSDDAE